MKNWLILFSIALFAFQACKTEQQATACTNYPSIEFNGTLYIQPKDSPGFSNTYTWEQAVDYCSNLDFDGCDDWYLPSVEELGEFVKHKKEIGDFEELPNAYWSASRDPQYNDYAYGVQFLYNNPNKASIYEKDYHRCRCVRK